MAMRGFRWWWLLVFGLVGAVVALVGVRAHNRNRLFEVTVDSHGIVAEGLKLGDLATDSADGARYVGDSAMAYWKGWLSAALDSTQPRHCVVLKLSPDVPLEVLDNLMLPFHESDHEKDTLLLEVGSRQPVSLGAMFPYGRDTGEGNVLFLEDSAVSLFGGKPESENLVRSVSVVQSHAMDTLAKLLRNVSTPTNSRELTVMAGGHSTLPFHRLSEILALLDTADEMARIDLRFGYGSERYRKLLRKSQDRESIDFANLGVDPGTFFSPPGTPDSGVRLEGLERLYFHETSVRDLAGEEGMGNKAGLPAMPLSLSTKVMNERPAWAGESWEESDLRWKDFPIPAVLPGHELVLRQVIYHAYTMKDYPTWWVMYDNGKRSGIWMFSGGIVDGKVLPNYELRQILSGRGRTFDMRLEGGSYHNSGTSTKGVELQLEADSGRLVLRGVRSAFTYLDDREVVRTEARRGSSIEAREIKNPSKPLLRSCGFTSEQDDHWTWNWGRLERVATCLTSDRKATVKHRALSAPSYIEEGWKDPEPEPVGRRR